MIRLHAVEGKSMLNLANATHDVCDHRILDHLSFKLSQKKLVECRICHDEDEESNMDIPCSCCGTLKYAHRTCVQRWCDEKGNTVCEICLEPFKPGYTSPPQLLHCDAIPTNFRGNWEISRRGLYDLQFLATRSAGHDEPEFDEYITLSSKSLICCRIVAIIFMTLLVLRHILPIIINGTRGYTVNMFAFVMLRSIGVLLSIYIMVLAFASVKHRQFVQVGDEENNILTASETRLHLVHVH